MKIIKSIYIDKEVKNWLSTEPKMLVYLFCLHHLSNEELIIHGYPIDGAMAQEGSESYRWFVYITTFLLR